MQISTKFSIAIHILLCVEVFKDTQKITSDFIASSAKTNPVIIRNIMGLLKESELIEVAAGTGGITLLRAPDKITLKDIFLAVEPIKNGKLFKIHVNSEPQCLVGGNILNILNSRFYTAQEAMEKQLAQTTLKDLLSDIERLQAALV